MLDETVWEHRLVVLEQAVSVLQHEIASRSRSVSERKSSEDRAKNPWLAIAGKYADDPNWEEYQAAIAANRQAVNTAEGISPDGDSIA
jgi:hypothetical protein